MPGPEDTNGADKPLPCPFCGEEMVKGTFDYWTHAENDCFLRRTQLHLSGLDWWNRRA